MFNLFKNRIKKDKPQEPDPVPSTPPKPKRQPKQPKPKPTAKELATKKGQPYISVLAMELSPDNIGIGAFELDWNEIFIAKLLNAGYKGTSEEEIVDQWFTDICRNVVMETYEQYEANSPRPVSGVQRKDIGDDRTEVS